MFKKYVKKPTIVEAVQFTHDNKDQVLNSLTGNFIADFEDGQPVLKVVTIHGDTAIVRLGDWIIKEKTPGFYYPVKDDIFRLIYKEKIDV